MTYSHGEITSDFYFLPLFMLSKFFCNKHTYLYIKIFPLEKKKFSPYENNQISSFIIVLYLTVYSQEVFLLHKLFKLSNFGDLWFLQSCVILSLILVLRLNVVVVVQIPSPAPSKDLRTQTPYTARYITIFTSPEWPERRQRKEKYKRKEKYIRFYAENCLD